MIKRLLEDRLKELLSAGRDIVVLFGARQTGKTTLVRSVVGQLPYRALSITADEALYPVALSSRNLEQLRGMVEGYDLLFIDEAQRIPEIGINLKLLHDALPSLRIIATGSSSLDLASTTHESLAGRAVTLALHPISLGEMAATRNWFEQTQDLASRLVYGSYPRVIEMTGNDERRAYLDNLVASALYKDLLEISRIRYSAKLRDLLRLLAYQVGQLVSYSELGTQLGMSHNTVAEYVDLLEKSYVIFRLGGYSRNLRNEVVRQPKIYFWDLGVRNTIIGNFAALTQRDDAGALWENFAIAERAKHLRYSGTHANLYFWRTHSGVEIDLVEEQDGALRAFECKWAGRGVRMPRAFLDAYPAASFDTFSPDVLQKLITIDAAQ